MPFTYIKFQSLIIWNYIWANESLYFSKPWNLQFGKGANCAFTKLLLFFKQFNLKSNRLNTATCFNTSVHSWGVLYIAYRCVEIFVLFFQCDDNYFQQQVWTLLTPTNKDKRKRQLVVSTINKHVVSFDKLF